MRKNLMNQASQRMRGMQNRELTNFIKYSDYNAFMRVVKSGYTASEVKRQLAGVQVGVSDLLSNQEDFLNQTNKFRYFDTYDEWEWFDVYAMTAYDLWRFWQIVYDDLYEIPRNRQGYRHLKPDQLGVQYIFQRFIQTDLEDDYTYWMWLELTSLPIPVINQLDPRDIPQYEWNLDQFQIETSGLTLPRDLQSQMQEVLNHKGLSSDWEEVFTQMVEEFDQIIEDIRHDERYENRRGQWLEHFKGFFKKRG